MNPTKAIRPILRCFLYPILRRTFLFRPEPSVKRFTPTVELSKRDRGVWSVYSCGERGSGEVIVIKNTPRDKAASIIEWILKEVGRYKIDTMLIQETRRIVHAPDIS